MSKCRAYLAAANTCEGFVSYFDDLLKSGERVLILKGGPGCGKSTFMRKVGNYLLDRNYKVDFIYCASDKESLDAIFVHDIKLIIVDGTAPHVIDPRYPGVIDSILNFGEFFDEDKLRRKGEEIKAVIDTKSNEYKKLYEVLKRAKAIHDTIEKEYLIGMNFERASEIANELINEVITREENKVGKEIHRFSGALTPQGQAVYYNDLTFDISKRYIIKGRAGSGKSTLMRKIGDKAISSGYDVEFYHCGLDPKSLDMVIIRDLSVAVLDGTSPHIVEPKGNDKVVDMFNECINQDIVDEDDKVIVSRRNEYNNEINSAKEIFKNIKNLHEKLEGLYSESVDFSKIDKIYYEIIGRIEKM